MTRFFGDLFENAVSRANRELEQIAISYDPPHVPKYRNQTLSKETTYKIHLSAHVKAELIARKVLETFWRAFDEELSLVDHLNIKSSVHPKSFERPKRAND